MIKLDPVKPGGLFNSKAFKVGLGFATGGPMGAVAGLAEEGSPLSKVAGLAKGVGGIAAGGGDAMGRRLSSMTDPIGDFESPTIPQVPSANPMMNPMGRRMMRSIA